MSKPTVGGLFFGGGGLEMAIPDTELRWVSEIDPHASKLIEQRFPGVPNLGDITKVDWTEVEPVDILTGGSPCQDVSHAGQRKGFTEGTRSNLWTEMVNAIQILKPRLVIWENVRGVLSAKADSNMGWTEGLLDSRTDEQKPAKEKDWPLRAMGRVLGDLSNLGYDAQWQTVRASDAGAPHRRERVFIVAYPRSE